MSTSTHLHTISTFSPAPTPGDCIVAEFLDHLSDVISDGEREFVIALFGPNTLISQLPPMNQCYYATYCPIALT